MEACRKVRGKAQWKFLEHVRTTAIFGNMRTKLEKKNRKFFFCPVIRYLKQDHAHMESTFKLYNTQTNPHSSRD